MNYNAQQYDVVHPLKGSGPAPVSYAASKPSHALKPRSTPRSSTDWRDHVFSAAALQNEEFDEISYVINDLIPEGLSILAGRPKVGKSWMALDIVLAVATGGYVLGDRQAIGGDVLYAALEDTGRRLQKRIKKILADRDTPWPERLNLATRWRKLDAGGVDDLRAWANSVANPKLIVLDTLAGVRPDRSAKDTLYDGDYKALAEIHAWANEKGIAVIILHHTRKMEADDPLNSVSGSLGLVGCADTTLVVARSSQGTTLYVRGRDIEEAEHAVTFNRDTCRWTIMGDAAEIRRSNGRGSILSGSSGRGRAHEPE